MTIAIPKSRFGAQILKIAIREYLAYVKTVGFWLSLLTVPLIIILSTVVPAMVIKSSGPETLAIVDLSQDGVRRELEAIIQDKTKSPPLPASLDRMFANNPAAKQSFDRVASSRVRLTSLNINPKASVDQAIAEAKTALSGPNGPSNVLIISPSSDGIDFIVVKAGDKEPRFIRLIKSQLNKISIRYKARALGLSQDAVKALEDNELKLETVTLAVTSPNSKMEKKAPSLSQQGGGSTKTQGLLGGLIGYFTWIGVFSSSMLLLSSVIEEKANRVLEVLLSSVGAETLLLGKILGVGMVLLTVVGLWGGVIFAVTNGLMALMPPEMTKAIMGVAGMVFAGQKIFLMLAYLLAGFVLYGLIFTVIGAFCETPKEAQAFIGPIMIILMIPMLTLQVAFADPSQPLIKTLSYVPLFSQFLMPVRLDHAQWWEIAFTFLLMLVIIYGLLGLGRRAFHQGALMSGKISFMTLIKTMLPSKD
jgi:ABC-2 type transport system permease protein